MMKKRILIALLCTVLLSLAACGTEQVQPESVPETTAAAETQVLSAETASSTETAEIPTEVLTEAPTEPETFIAATVSVDFADAGLPAGTYETFTAVDEPQTKIILSTNATVRDFKVLALTDGDVDDDGEMHFNVQELYTLDRLTADRPLVVATTFYGLIPNNGISYVDETGATRTFAVDMSGEDGSLYLWEIK